MKCQLCEELNALLSYPLNEEQKIKVCITCMCILAQKDKGHDKPKIYVKKRKETT